MSLSATLRHCDPMGNIGMRGRSHSQETKRKMSLSAVGNKRGCGHHVSDESVEKLRKRSIGNTYFKGRKHTKQWKNRMRVIALDRILTSGMIPSQGRNEVALLDSQEKIDNVHIIRQYPITKLGYVVDGYCPETNTVYEVYERYHNRQVQKDLGRETKICNMLSCNFHIIWDTNF